MRKIIKEELLKLIEGIEDTPAFNDPKMSADELAKWQGKARTMNQFYWKVSEIIGTIDMTAEEKLLFIKNLLPHYGWV